MDVFEGGFSLVGKCIPKRDRIKDVWCSLICPGTDESISMPDRSIAVPEYDRLGCLSIASESTESSEAGPSCEDAAQTRSACTLMMTSSVQRR